MRVWSGTPRDQTRVERGVPNLEGIVLSEEIGYLLQPYSVMRPRGFRKESRARISCPSKAAVTHFSSARPSAVWRHSASPPLSCQLSAELLHVCAEVCGLALQAASSPCSSFCSWQGVGCSSFIYPVAFGFSTSGSKVPHSARPLEDGEQPVSAVQMSRCWPVSSASASCNLLPQER